MKASLRILHLEDSSRDAELVQHCLADGACSCDILVVANRSDYEAAVRDQRFDVILCDYNIPGYSGRRALEAAKEHRALTPVIMLSGAVSEDEAVACLHIGAADYVLKQSLFRLPSAVDRAIRIAKEQAMREEAERRFRSLMELSPDAMVIVDGSARIALVNAQTENLFGYGREEMTGQPVEMLVPVRFRRRHEAQVSEFLHSGRARKIAIPTELFGLRKDGSEVPLEILLNPLEQSAERLTIAAIRDLTERRRLEASLSRAKRMESIGAFAGNIAHDLNNALGPVMLSLDLLRAGHPESEELIGTLESGTQRGADMLRQLLVFSKGSYVEHKQVELAPLLREAQRVIEATFPKIIDARFALGDHLAAVWGDKTQLHQVLMNLCVNARDAMPDGGVLTISAENIVIDGSYASAIADARPGAYVMCRISDTGIGMTPDILDRIFEPFYSTKGHGKGTGLGLSIVIGIVKSHGGFVTAYSMPEKGTTFAVYLPAEVVPALSEDESNVTQPTLHGAGRTILVVDDSEPLRLVAGEVLTSLGFKACLAGDGSEALELVDALGEELALVISDLDMPRMHGHEFAAELKRRLPNVGVIVVSGILHEDTVLDLKAMGVTAFLEKPFTQDMLVGALRSILQE